MKTRAPYLNLSREELLEKAYEIGGNFEVNSYSCSQSTVAAIHEIVGLSEDVVKASTTLCGGVAFQGLGACGGLSGGVIALDYFFGRPWENMSYTEQKEENINLLFLAQQYTRPLYDKYVQKYGTIMCAAIQQQLFNRYYYFEDLEEFKKCEIAGAHTDPQKCRDVVGTAARWVMEILIDRGGLEVPK